MSGYQHCAEQFLPFDPDVPETARHQYADADADHIRRTRKIGRALADQLGAVLDRGRCQAIDLLGAETWVALRRRMREERLSFHDLLQPPAGLLVDYDGAGAACKTNVQTFLDDLWVDTDTLRTIYRDVADGVDELLPVVDAAPGYATWLNPGELAEVRSDRTPGDTRSAWQTFRPPFAGYQESFDPFANGAFRVSRVHHRDERTGLAGHEVRLDNTDAGAFDNGWARVDTQVAFWFLPPRTGTVEAVVEARCGRGSHELRILDEWGTSDSRTSQKNYLMMHVVHGNVAGPSFGSMSRFLWTTADARSKSGTDVSGSVQREFLTPGGVYTARLFSDGPVPANQWVVIRAGTRSADAAITNDIQVNSLSVFRWFIQAVHVRIAA